ncbi:MAG: FecR domain-containing protein, partial [Rhodospirillaceae bacterium]|nr:FecR domain-containing protein [Rhodospirillaceae bacterium]
MANTATMTEFTYGAPIGQVETLTGMVHIVHTDGTETPLAIGGPVYQGDVIATGDDGAVGVVLADQTVFSMAENGRITLDEMVFDAATQDGSVALTASEGIFTFVSGMVAKTNPDAMTIETPLATIGIRGTQLGVELGDDTGLRVIMMEEEGGFTGEVVVTSPAGVMVLNAPYQGTWVANVNAAPTTPFNVSMNQLLNMFGGALGRLPDIGDANNYGLDEASVEKLGEEMLAQEVIQEIIPDEELADEVAMDESLAKFETAAGDSPPEAAPTEFIPVLGEDFTEGVEIQPIDIEFTAPSVGAQAAAGGGFETARVDAPAPNQPPPVEPEPVPEP